jgi:hypothetical protein
MTTRIDLTSPLLRGNCEACSKPLREEDQDLIQFKCKHVFHSRCSRGVLEHCKRFTAVVNTIVKGKDKSTSCYFSIPKPC